MREEETREKRALSIFDEASTRLILPRLLLLRLPPRAVLALVTSTAAVDHQTPNPWHEEARGEHPRRGGDEDDVAHSGQQRPRQDVEDERVQDDVGEDGLRLPHQLAVGGEVVGGRVDAQEEDGGQVLPAALALVGRGLAR